MRSLRPLWFLCMNLSYYTLTPMETPPRAHCGLIPASPRVAPAPVTPRTSQRHVAINMTKEKSNRSCSCFSLCSLCCPCCCHGGRPKNKGRPFPRMTLTSQKKGGETPRKKGSAGYVALYPNDKGDAAELSLYPPPDASEPELYSWWEHTFCSPGRTALRFAGPTAALGINSLGAYTQHVHNLNPTVLSLLAALIVNQSLAPIENWQRLFCHELSLGFASAAGYCADILFFLPQLGFELNIGPACGLTALLQACQYLQEKGNYVPDRLLLREILDLRCRHAALNEIVISHHPEGAQEENPPRHTPEPESPPSSRPASPGAGIGGAPPQSLSDTAAGARGMHPTPSPASLLLPQTGTITPSANGTTTRDSTAVTPGFDAVSPALSQASLTTPSDDETD